MVEPPPKLHPRSKVLRIPPPHRPVAIRLIFPQKSDPLAEPISETTPLLGDVSHRLRGDLPVIPRLVDLCKTCLAAANSKTGRKIIKCSLAYVLGSLATYIHLSTENPREWVQCLCGM